jgi:hypothetical protein
MKIIKIVFFSAILALFAGVGCNQTSNTSSDSNNNKIASRGIDPCGLIDKAEIDALYNVSAEIIQRDLEPINPVGQKMCVYDIPSDDALTMVVVSVHETGDMSRGMTAEQLFNSQKEFLENVTEVQGIGANAFQTQMDFVGGGAVYFLTSDKNVLISIDVSLGKLDHTANQAAEQKFAKQILEKLK